MIFIQVQKTKHGSYISNINVGINRKGAFTTKLNSQKVLKYNCCI